MRTLLAYLMPLLFLFMPLVAQAALTDNIVAYWKFDEGSGTTASDATWNGNTGILGGTTPPTWTTGIINDGLSFPGANSNVDIGSFQSLFANGNVTINAWVDPANTTSRMDILDKANGTNYAGEEWYWALTSGNMTLEISNGTSAQDFNSTGTYAANTWQMVTITYASSTGAINFYINGVNAGSGTYTGGTPNSNSVSASLGSMDGGYYFFNGKMDEVGVWSRVLSPSEISQLYNGGAGLQYPFGDTPLPPKLNIDGYADDAGSFSDSNIDQVTLTTGYPNDVIVLEETNETNGGPLATVSSISDTYGLSWYLRAATSTRAMISNGVTTPDDMEVWYAIATSSLSSDTITVTLDNTVDDGSVIAFGINGANLSSPWDSNSSLPVESINPNGDSVPCVSGLSTNASNVMLLGLEGSGLNDQSGPDTTEGYREIDFSQNNGGSNFSSAEAEEQVVSSAISNATISFGSGISEWFMIGDAIQAASSGGGSTPSGRIIRLTGGLRLIGGIRLL